MHTLIAGMTGRGKTTLAVELAHRYRAKGRKVICLDPQYDSRWAADFKTANSAEFVAVVQASRGCMVFIDEAGERAGHYETEMHWLATRGRHWGHGVHFLTQRPKQLPPVVRDQCEMLFLFTIGHDDAREVAKDWARDELRSCVSLPKGAYWSCLKGEPPVQGTVVLPS